MIHTHLYHLNKANGEMSAVSPLTIVSRTWPLRLTISRVVWEQMYDSLSKQWSQRHLGALDQTILRPSSCFSSQMADSVAFNHGIRGSVCFTWTVACLHLLQNSSCTCSKAPSMTMIFGTPSCWKSRESEHHGPLTSFSLDMLTPNHSSWSKRLEWNYFPEVTAVSKTKYQ